MFYCFPRLRHVQLALVAGWLYLRAGFCSVHSYHDSYCFELYRLRLQSILIYCNWLIALAVWNNLYDVIASIGWEWYCRIKHCHAFIDLQKSHSKKCKSLGLGTLNRIVTLPLALRTEQKFNSKPNEWSCFMHKQTKVNKVTANWPQHNGIEQINATTYK